MRDYYPQLSDGERDEREEFVVEACYHMRERFNQKELWENLGLPVKEAVEATMKSEQMAMFRKRLFSRIVPTVKDIGLWGPRVQKAFEDMGAIEFAEIDAEALLENDQRVAEEFDADAVRPADALTRRGWTRPWPRRLAPSPRRSRAWTCGVPYSPRVGWAG